MYKIIQVVMRKILASGKSCSSVLRVIPCLAARGDPTSELIWPMNDINERGTSQNVFQFVTDVFQQMIQIIHDSVNR